MTVTDFFTDMRSLYTLVSFVTFIGIVMWAYSGRRKQAYEEAANLPFADEAQDDKQAGTHHG